MLYKSHIIRFILGIISLILAIGLLRSILSHFTRSDEVEIRKQELIKEELRNKELISELIEATSPAFIEKQAREKLGFAKEADTIILLDKSTQSNSHDQTNQGKAKSFWEKWWSLFF